MKRLFFLVSAISLSMLALSGEAGAAPHKAKLFVDASRSLTFEIPRGWQAKEGIGEIVATLMDKDTGRISIFAPWRSDVPTGEGVVRILAELYSGARMGDIRADQIGGKEARIMLFDFDGRERTSGVAIGLANNRCDVNIICADVPQKFASTFLACREIASHLRCDLEFDRSQWDEAFRSAISRGIFALMDGRAGCRGYRDEPARMAAIAKDLGRHEDAALLALIADSLSSGPRAKDTAQLDGIFKAYKETHDLFSKIMRADSYLEEGNISKARKVIDDIESAMPMDSHLLWALKVKIARIENDTASAEKAFDGLEGGICGRSGAMAAYELGRAEGTLKPDKSRGLFEKALAADPTFIPAYVFLGQALMMNGMTAKASYARLCAWLMRAPDVPEVRRLKAHIATVEMNSHP
jgi:tetratricopeptide (TPR) repeat protein